MCLSRKSSLFPLLYLICMGCQPNYFLSHPLEPVPGIYRESEFFDEGQLRTHWLARYPDRKERLPAVLIHPDRGSLSGDMEGVCLALAGQGYFAVAVDYQRVDHLNVRNPLMPWRSAEEALVSLKHLQSHPRVNPERIALLGYSKGAILSLQIAALDRGIRGVVAYYPLADFEEWREEVNHSFRGKLLSWYFKWKLRKETVSHPGEPAKNWGTSPINLVEKIDAPVLLIHGEKDRTFPVTQSRRLCDKFHSAGKRCALFVVPGAGHVFNFINEKQGESAWRETTRFLEKYLK